MHFNVFLSVFDFVPVFVFERNHDISDNQNKMDTIYISYNIVPQLASSGSPPPQPSVSKTEPAPKKPPHVLWHICHETCKHWMLEKVLQEMLDKRARDCQEEAEKELLRFAAHLIR